MRFSAFRTATIILLVMQVVSSSFSSAQNQADGSARTAQTEDDIREAVFRLRMDRIDKNVPIFLTVDGRDPSDSFIARFSKLNRVVKKASQSYVQQEDISVRTA